MAELGNLSIVVDLSGLMRATAAVNSFSALVAKMANEVEQLRGKKGPSDLSLTIDAMAQSVRKADADLVKMMNTLNRNAGKGLDANAKAADAMAQSVRKADADLVKMMNTLNRNAGKGLDAQSRAAEALAIKIGKAEAAAHRMNKAMDEKKSSAKPAAGGGGWLDGLMDVKNRAGVAVSAQGGLNPFAASMVTMPPQLAAVAVAAGVALGGITALAEGVFSLGASALETGMKFQRLAATLAVVGGGKAGAAKEFEYVTEMANKFGIGLEAATNSYSKFALSAQVAGMSQKQTRSIFEATSKSIVATGVSSDAGARAFLALEQALSKGTLQAEEVKKQFAGNLPGGFAMFAEAAYRAGKTADSSISTFMKAMKTGTLESKAIILELANVMENKFGSAFAGASDNVERNINRMKNAWDIFLLKVSEFGVMESVNVIVRSVINILGGLQDKVTELFNTVEGKMLVQSFVDLAESIARAMGEVASFSPEGDALKKIVSTLAVTIEWAASSLDQFIAKLKVMAAWAPVIGSPLAVLQSSVRANIAAANKQMAEADARMEGFTTRTKARILSIDQLGAKAPRMGLSAQLSSGAVEMYSEDDVKKDTKAAESAKGVKDIGVSASYSREEVKKLADTVSDFRTEMEKLTQTAEAKTLADAFGTKAAISDFNFMLWQLQSIQKQQEAIASGTWEPTDYKSKPGSFELGNPELDRMLGRTKGRGEGFTITEAEVALQNEYIGGSRTLLQYTQDLITVNQKFGTTMGQMWGKAKDVMADFGRSFSDTMVDFAFGWDDGTMSASDRFKKMVGDMCKQLAKLIFYYGVLVPLIKAAFGESYGGLSKSGAQAGASSMTGIMNSVPPQATGGSVTAGSSYLVGERGPEMFVPGRSGAIANNSQLTGGSSTPPININIVVTPTSTTTEKKSGGDERGNASKLARQLGDAVRGVIMEELRPGGLIRESAR